MVQYGHLAATNPSVLIKGSLNGFGTLLLVLGGFSDLSSETSGNQYFEGLPGMFFAAKRPNFKAVT